MKRFILFTFVLFTSTCLFSQNNMQPKTTWNSTSLEKQELQSQLKIYPNPCKGDYLNIDFSSKKISELIISNIAGKVVLKKKINFPANKVRLQISDIPNGIYLAKIKTVSNKTLVKKLIVSKQ